MQYRQRTPASKGPYIIYRQKAPYRHAGSPINSYNKSPCRQMVPTESGPYRQVALTYKGALQTRGPYIKGAPTDKWAYRQGALTDKEFIQIRGFHSKGPL